MSVPKKIVIRREADYHTHHIGSHANGQFMGFVTATIPAPPPQDWQSVKRWYAVLYTFDDVGVLEKAAIQFCGATADGERGVIEKAQKTLNGWFFDLKEIAFGDVTIDLFSVDFDGRTFGLVDASTPDENHWRIDLVPNDLAFFPPWDGCYDT